MLSACGGWPTWLVLPLLRSLVKGSKQQNTGHVLKPTIVTTGMENHYHDHAGNYLEPLRLDLGSAAVHSSYEAASRYLVLLTWLLLGHRNTDHK